MARLARWAGIVADAFSGVSLKLCRISARSPGLAAKNMSLISAASLGRIARFACIRNCASVGGFAGCWGRGSVGIASASGTRSPGCAGFNPSWIMVLSGVPG